MHQTVYCDFWNQTAMFYQLNWMFLISKNKHGYIFRFDLSWISSGKFSYHTESNLTSLLASNVICNLPCNLQHTSHEFLYNYFISLISLTVKAISLIISDFHFGVIPHVKLISYIIGILSPNRSRVNSFDHILYCYYIFTGEESWPNGIYLRFIQGHQLGSQDRVQVEALTPKCATDISIQMHSPAQCGLFQGQWRMCTETGLFFGGWYFSIPNILLYVMQSSKMSLNSK